MESLVIDTPMGEWMLHLLTSSECDRRMERSDRERQGEDVEVAASGGAQLALLLRVDVGSLIDQKRRPRTVKGESTSLEETLDGG